jgi:excisionase family DNA binding protein
MSIEFEELLTVSDVAERLKVNPQTVRNWIDRGELAGIRVGPRRVRVRSCDLQTFLDVGSTARRPDALAARRDYEQAIERARASIGYAEEAASLRRVAKAAGALVRALR